MDNISGNSSCVSRFCLGVGGASRPAGLYVISWGRGARGNGYDIFRSLTSAGCRRGRNCATPAFHPPFRRSICPSHFESSRLALPHPRAGLTCAHRESEARRLDTAGRQSLAIAWTLSLPAESFFRISVSVPRRALIYCIYIFTKKII